MTTEPPTTSVGSSPIVHRLTAGSGRSTEMDTSSPSGNESEHGTRLYCVISHFSHDDPVVYPGRPGAAHAHMFWGNTETNAYSTGRSLMASGNSSCEGGINNRSSYWAPALFNQADEVVIPETVFVYYKSFGGPGFDRSTIQPIPAGLEMLASRDVPNSGPWNFTVGGSSSVNLNVSFPVCVQVDRNGSPVLASADNVSHLSYATNGGTSNSCPASHPYRIPQLIYVLRYDIPFSSGWSLASDTSSSQKGESLHADYIAAWDPATMDHLVDCNILAKRNCSFYGGRGQLPERFLAPDGTQIYSSGVELAPQADRTPFGIAIGRFTP
ncbi:MAG: DUF1996 domain-containing protein [Acidimicrobiales bacterium]